MSAALGENPQTIQADWIMDRVAGKPAKREQLLIDATGRTNVSPLQ